MSQTTVATRGERGVVAGVEYFVYGEGDPVTVFAHGLAGSVSEIKPLAMPLTGTRVLFHFHGHGNSEPLIDGWDYELLCENLRNVADEVGATRACGLSLGTGALLRLLREDPHRFERLVFVMPAALDQPRTDGALAHLFELGQAIESRDISELSAVLLAELPEHVREQRITQILIARRAAELAAMVPPAPRYIDVPVSDLNELSAITAPALVLAQEGDRLHSTQIAERLASALPSARLEILEPGGIFWTQPETTKHLLNQYLT